MGDYLAVVEIRYSNSFAVSSDMFGVVERQLVTLKDLLKMPVSGLIVMIVILAGLLFLFISGVLFQVLQLLLLPYLI